MKIIKMKPQETKTSDSEVIRDWNRKAWLWVLLCCFAIFFTIPVARSIQKIISNTIGRDFFTYFVIFIVACGLAVMLYLFIIKFKVRKISQYAWLVICAGIYIFLTIKLDKYPEEAIHLIEFGLLSYFIFNALQYKIRDRAIYIITILIVLFIGTTDEVIQWITPQTVLGFSRCRDKCRWRTDISTCDLERDQARFHRSADSEDFCKDANGCTNR